MVVDVVVSEFVCVPKVRQRNSRESGEVDFSFLFFGDVTVMNVQFFTFML